MLSVDCQILRHGPAQSLAHHSKIAVSSGQAQGWVMSIRKIVFCVGCVIAWFILLPLFLVSGGLSLLAYALFGEISEVVIGRRKTAMDANAAREIARRLCLSPR
jgi:hypothetical protein